MPTDHFRALARRPVNLPATLVSEEEGWEREARLVDLGLGGACIEVAEAVSTGVPVTLRVTAPTLWDPLVLQARVAWLRLPSRDGQPTRVGMRFEYGPKPPLGALVELLGANVFE